MPIGPTELIIILVIVLVIFGPKRLPSLGRSLGSGMREFKDSVTAKSDSGDKPEEETPEIEQPSAESKDPASRSDAEAAFGEGSRDAS